VRIYLREISSVELLSREDEIAIAKRIEAGREAMIAGLCESPLTFQAIIIRRDELNDGKTFLRDIIDIEATYFGPHAKAISAGVPGVVAPPTAPPFPPVTSPQLDVPPSPTRAATPFRLEPQIVDGAQPPQGALGESDVDEDDLDNSMSLTEIEAELARSCFATTRPATANMGGACAGVGTIFGHYLAAALRNPSAAQGQFGNLIFGFAVTEALGIFSFVIALLPLFAL